MTATKQTLTERAATLDLARQIAGCGDLAATDLLGQPEMDDSHPIGPDDVRELRRWIDTMSARNVRLAQALIAATEERDDVRAAYADLVELRKREAVRTAEFEQRLGGVG